MRVEIERIFRIQNVLGRNFGPTAIPSPTQHTYLLIKNIIIILHHRATPKFRPAFVTILYAQRQYPTDLCLRILY